MRLSAFLFALMLAVAGPAAAHHPGDRLDEVMAGREPAFEPSERRDLPSAEFTLADGSDFTLDDLTDRIVVLSLVPDDCGAPCIAQQALLQRVQGSVNVTPMRDMVLFVTVGAAPDTGWEPVNWHHAAPHNGTAADLARAFAVLSARDSAAPMVHILDRGGRHAGIFHGSGFGPVNMVLYINGLTNAPPPEPGLWDRVMGAFQ